MDFTSVLAAVDFATVTGAIASVAAILAGVLVARKGARYVLGFIK